MSEPRDIVADAEAVADRLFDPEAEWVYEDGTPFDPKNHETDLSDDDIRAIVAAFNAMEPLA